MSAETMLLVKKSAIAGRGVFAKTDICAKTRLVEYMGALRRWADYTDDGTSYVFLMGIGRGMVIDPRIRGNKARFINHSCSPNCEAILDGEKVFIDSLTDIEKGAELTFNYALELSPGEDASKYPCQCGSPKCKGTMVKKKKRRRKARVRAASH
jgi:SET domain-containing protein